MSENQTKKKVGQPWMCGGVRKDNQQFSGPSAHNPTINAAGVDGDARGRVHNEIVAIVSKIRGG
jgi:hypothetical protein